jgi:hypothetical protein
VDAAGQCGVVRVHRTHDDPAVIGLMPMLFHVVSPVERQDSAILAAGELQNLVVWNALIGVARLVGREYIMAERA